jgi:glycine cleavage system H lipoate-binding protein
MRRVADENRKLMEQGGIPRGKRGRIVFWKEKLKEQPLGKRPCIHHMKERIDFRVCTNEYNCGNCEFDQYFNDQHTVHAVVKPVGVLDIEGFRIPQGFYFHRGHAWAKIEENSMVRVGIDDFALRLLGPLDRIEAPLVGKEIKQDQADISVTRGSNNARFLAPVSGVITDINPRVRENGSVANQAPYSEGWVMRVHSDNLRQDLKNLMIGSQTKDSLQKEIDLVYQEIENVAGPLAADGGNLGHDIYGSMPQIGWDRLTRLFLRS